MRHPPPEILGIMSPFLPLYPSYATERKREEAGSAGACYYHQPGAKLSLRRCRRRRRFFARRGDGRSGVKSKPYVQPDTITIVT